MGRIISMIADDLSFFSDPGGMAINGGMMSVAALLRRFIAEESVEALEVFLPPALMIKSEPLREAARHFLPPHKRAQGALRFYPFHALGEIWSDGAPRIMYCLDVELLPRHRYLRDRFAVGPTPIVADTHSFSHYSLWTALSPLSRASYVTFDSIVCRSPSSMETMRRGFTWLHEMDKTDDSKPILPCRLDELAYCLDTELFHPTDEDGQADARRILNLPQEGQIAMFLGRVTAYSKGDLLPLLSAFKQATSRDNDYLLIVGVEFPPGYGEKLREAGDALGLDERLIIVGEIKPMMRPLYFRAADLFVFPGETTVETFGNTVIEAMASGLPVIVSDWDGLRRHVREGENGRLIPTYWMPGLDQVEAFSPLSTRWSAQLFLGQSVWLDTDVLTQSLREFLDDPALRTQMGTIGRVMAEEIYGSARIMADWHQLWNELEKSAQQEPPADAQARRTGALALGLPLPYLDLFGHYATGVLHPKRYAVHLTEFGQEVADERAQVEFYDETLPLLREIVMQHLLSTLWHNRANPVLISDLAHSTATATSTSPDEVRFHIGLLLKRGLLELSEVVTEDAV